MTTSDELKAKPVLPTISAADVAREITAIEIRPPITVAGQALFPYAITCHHDGVFNAFRSTNAAESLKRLLGRGGVEADSVQPARPNEPAIILVPEAQMKQAEALFENLMQQISSAVGARDL